jgi:hypothetical protein
MSISNHLFFEIHEAGRISDFKGSLIFEDGEFISCRMKMIFLGSFEKTEPRNDRQMFESRSAPCDVG